MPRSRPPSRLRTRTGRQLNVTWADQPEPEPEEDPTPDPAYVSPHIVELDENGFELQPVLSMTFEITYSEEAATQSPQNEGNLIEIVSSESATSRFYSPVQVFPDEELVDIPEEELALPLEGPAGVTRISTVIRQGPAVSIQGPLLIFEGPVGTFEPDYIFEGPPVISEFQPFMTLGPENVSDGPEVTSRGSDLIFEGPENFVAADQSVISGGQVVIAETASNDDKRIANENLVIVSEENPIVNPEAQVPVINSEASSGSSTDLDLSPSEPLRSSHRVYAIHGEDDSDDDDDDDTAAIMDNVIQQIGLLPQYERQTFTFVDEETHEIRTMFQLIRVDFEYDEPEFEDPGPPNDDADDDPNQN